AGVKPDQIDIVELEKDDGATAKFVKSGDTWMIDDPIKTKADGGQITRIVEDLFKARPVQFGELSSSKATHGLEPPGLKITLRQGSERAVTVNVGDVTAGGRAAV